MPTLLGPVAVALDACIAAIEDGESHVELRGSEGLGKSTVLAELERSIESRPIVRLAPPLFQPDDASWAYAQLTDGLSRHIDLNGAGSAAQDPSVPWPSKLRSLMSAVDELDSLVLVCDEPSRWGAASDPHYKTHAVQLFDLLRARRQVQLVVSDRNGSGIAERRIIDLQTAPAPWTELEDWGGLADMYAELRAASHHPVSPLAWRLTVALGHVAGAPAAVKSACEHVSIRRLVRSLYAALRDQGGDRTPLLDFMTGLRHVRGLVDDTVLALIGADELSGADRDIALRCLTSRAGSARLLHPQVRRGLTDVVEQQPEVHRRLAGHYRVHADSRASVKAIEAFYQAGATGDVGWALGFDVAFADQLTALGRDLSLRVGDHEAAVHVFERAVRLAPADDYALHYLGFNLDYLAREPARVEQLYREALELDDSNPWWHGRLIAFLISRGRAGDAQAAWEQALDRAHPRWPVPEHWLHRNLSFWVAYNWTVLGYYDAAERILGDMPVDLVEGDPGIHGLRVRLAALTEARDWGAFVPADEWEPDWWHRSPTLLPLTEAGAALNTWFAGRIADVSGGVVHVDAVEIAPDRLADGRPPRVSPSLSLERFRQYAGFAPVEAISVGRYVQIGFYGEEGVEEGIVRIALCPLRSRRSTLPELRPDPYRWARSRGLLVA